MLEIDGSYGEGGGQLVRTAVALAAMTGKTILIRNIRAKRPKSGLAAQHLTAVRAVATLCSAEVSGLEIGAGEIVFRPRQLHGGDFTFDVGTAGSVTLVLQAVLPAAIACSEPSRLSLTGGTDVKAAPPLDYFRYVLLSLLNRMTLQASVTVQRRGYYPRGGGMIEVNINPAQPLRPLCLETPGALEEINGIVHIANLPAHILERMRQTALNTLSGFPKVHIAAQALGGNDAIGQGGAIALWARTQHTLLGAAITAERGVTAERIGSETAQALRDDITAGVTLDIHASDQILIYLAMAQGPSRFLVRTLSSHAHTTMWLLQQFLPVRFHSTQIGGLIHLDVFPS